MELKDNIKKLRNERGLSCDELAMLLGEPEASTREWETGESRPTESAMRRMCSLFGITMAELKLVEEDKNAGFMMYAPLSPEARRFASDLHDKLLGAVRGLDRHEEAQNFASSMYTFLSDLFTCSSLLSSVLMEDKEAQARSAEVFSQMRRISDMDYRSMWDKLEKAFYQEVPEDSELDSRELAMANG
ncbi:MAG: helix-turn-helix domain-containing protein [Clostridiales bacterium]|jgi:transcriptional regulator with XRE-family HTH domain|nr:helix-turn-helix domain-containing protein [Clostridiales bacterium]